MTALSLPRVRRPRPIALLVASVAIVAATQLSTFVRPGPPITAPAAPVTVNGPVTPPEAPITSAPSTLAKIDHSITAWTHNVATNDKDFLSAANLGLLYEARARLSGDVSDYTRATDATDRSLAIEPKQVDVLALHARLALATHDFGRALSEARSLDRIAPNQPAILAIIGDADLELGDVDGAVGMYDRIQALAPGASVTARLARVAFLQGDPMTAVRDAEAAR